jgi:hypothetical protein
MVFVYRQESLDPKILVFLNVFKSLAFFVTEFHIVDGYANSFIMENVCLNRLWKGSVLTEVQNCSGRSRHEEHTMKA